MSWKDLVKQASVQELKDIYEGVMHPHDLGGVEKFVVRQWDGMDGSWCDATKAVSLEEALRVWFEKTEGGEKKTKFSDIDYYRIFPASSRMAYSGNNEMFR